MQVTVKDGCGGFSESGNLHFEADARPASGVRRRLVPMEPIRVVAAVIERDGKILACRRAPHKSLAGLWEFPGGKVEPGETDEVALAREIREELGLIIEVGKQIFEVQDLNHENFISLGFMRAALLNSISDLSLTDHDKAVFLDLEEIRGLEWSPLDKRMATNLIDLIADLA